MNRRTALTMLVFFAALGVGGARAEEASADIGGTFMLVDQDGRNVSDEDFRGRFMLVAFGYTHCPDVCPTTLMTMASALHRLGGEADKIRPLFISLDPARDTPARLKEYVGSFGDNFVGLSGPEAFVKSVAAKYHVKFSKQPGAGGDYSLDHSAAIFLMAPDGAFVRRFAYDISAADLATQLAASVNSAKM